MQPEPVHEEWLLRARANLALARCAAEGVLFEDLCLQVQQCAEKALKGLLLQRTVDYPYTHDIMRLFTVLASVEVEVPPRILGAGFLTRFALDTRYPGSEPPVTADEYADAIRAAEEVLDWVVSMLPASGRS